MTNGKDTLRKGVCDTTAQSTTRWASAPGRFLITMPLSTGYRLRVVTKEKRYCFMELCDRGAVNPCIPARSAGTSEYIKGRENIGEKNSFYNNVPNEIAKSGAAQEASSENEGAYSEVCDRVRVDDATPRIAAFSNFSSGTSLFQKRPVEPPETNTIL